MCIVLSPKDTKSVSIKHPDKDGYYLGSKQAKWRDIAARYIYFYGDIPRSEIVSPNSSLIRELYNRDLIVERIVPNKNDDDYPRSYCSLSYQQENGKDGLSFVILNNDQVSYFALDKRNVSHAFENRKSRRSEKLDQDLLPKSK